MKITWIYHLLALICMAIAIHNISWGDGKAAPTFALLAMILRIDGDLIEIKKRMGNLS
jgi:hypothetical protein